MSQKLNVSFTNCRRSDFRLLAAVAFGAVLLSGCAHVQPWQRGVLSESVMRADSDPLGMLFAEHMWFSREAVAGGRGVGGGGCGCN
jgi:hypothetical protein